MTAVGLLAPEMDTYFNRKIILFLNIGYLLSGGQYNILIFDINKIKYYNFTNSVHGQGIYKVLSF